MSGYSTTYCKFGRALWLALSLAAVFARAENRQETGEYFLQQYSPKTYSGAPQNFDILQDARGIMYFANTDGGVLEYDGAKWRHISLGGPAFSLGLGPDGVVYAGGENQFGYLEADRSGQLAFVSLLEHVPEAYRRFGNVLAIRVAPTGTWFVTRDYLFRLSPARELRTVSGMRFRTGFVANNRFYVLTDSGLYQSDDLKLSRIAGAEALPKDPIRGYLRYRGATLVATAAGLYRQAKNGSFAPWKTGADAYLKTSVLNSCLELKNGQLAIATLSGGLVLLNPDGSLARIIDQDQALRSHFIRALYEDHGHGLWMALDRGLAKIDAESPISTFGEREGVQELVNAIERQNGQLYIGTSIGLSYLKAAADGSTPRFEAVDGVREMVLSLLPTKYDLIAGTQFGIYSVNGLKAKRLIPTNVIFDLATSPSNPNIVFAAGRSVLYVLEHGRKGWDSIRRIEPQAGELRSVTEDRDGWLWVTTHQSILHINWKVEPAAIRKYGRESGLIPGWMNVFRLRTGITITTEKGLRRFDLREQRFVPDERWGRMFAEGQRGAHNLREDERGNVWVTGDGYHGLLRRGTAGLTWEESPLARSGVKELYSIHIDRDGVVWASGADGGLVRYDRAGQLSAAAYSILLRKSESLKTKALIYAGETRAPESPSLAYRDNALRFEFAYPFYEDEAHTMYQVRLDGLDKDWSAWSTEAEKEYTNLPERHYTLKIRARDIYGRESREAAFAFRMLPPWYRTWWAYLLYAFGVIGSLFLFVKWRLAQMASHTRKLERLIADRTTEVRRQRDEIQAQEEETEALLLNILPASIAEELRVTGSVRPQGYEEVAVCFTDFVAFTLASEQMTAPELVDTLHLYFTAFDDVIERYRLEKLKTIGDAYMFVGGLPSPRPSFAVDTVLAALELLAVAERLGEEMPGNGWQIRIGIHCGPAVAGVVGKKKFAFDIWGETVNLASRIETGGQPNRINLSEDAYLLVKDFIECEARGPIHTKEGRMVNMYFVRQVHPALLEEPGKFAELYMARFGTVPPPMQIHSRMELRQSAR